MNRSHIRSGAAAAAAALVLAGIVPPATAAESAMNTAATLTPQQEFQSMGHEFQLESGETLLLFHRRKTTNYRVCVDTFKGAVPLKVLTDGAESEIAVASCETVSGRHVSVETGAKLPPGEYLVARFKRVED